MKVSNLKVRSYEFTAEVDDIDIEGEFKVVFKNRYPVIEIIYLSYPELKELVQELKTLILETDDGTWYDDYLDAQFEKRREFYEER